MLTIKDGGSLARALNLPIDPRLKQLLMECGDQLSGEIKDNARSLIIQPGDSIKALEPGLGWSFVTTPEGHSFGGPDYYPGWAWLADHGYCFKMDFILTDYGFAHVALVPKQAGINPKVLQLFAEYVTETV